MSKKLMILGGGESGVGAAILAAQNGYDVFVSDGGPLRKNINRSTRRQGIEFEEGNHTVERILDADEVMKSPGIPEKTIFGKEDQDEGNPGDQRDRTGISL